MFVIRPCCLLVLGLSAASLLFAQSPNQTSSAVAADIVTLGATLVGRQPADCNVNSGKHQSHDATHADSAVNFGR